MELPSPPTTATPDAGDVPWTTAPTLSPSDRATPTPAVSSSSSDDDEAARRRLWRRRRVEKTERMRAQVACMEQFALALPLVHDADAIWDEFLEPETKRVRDALRRLAPAAKEARELVAQQHELQRLLREHALATETLKALVTSTTSAMDDWDSQVDRWERLAREHFRAWTPAQCVAELQVAMAEANRFSVSRDTQSTGLSFMGWEDSRRVDKDSSTFYFSFHKTYRDHDLDHQLGIVWKVFTSSAAYTKHVLGNRGRAHVDVLQQLTPMLAVVLYHERYEGSDSTFHALAILATIEKDNMIMNLIRTIDSPELRNVFGSPDDVWVSKFYWKQFDILDPTKPRSQTDFRASVRGSIGDVNLEYVNLWLFEVLATVIRNEPYTTGRCLLKF